MSDQFKKSEALVAQKNNSQKATKWWKKARVKVRTALQFSMQDKKTSIITRSDSIVLDSNKLRKTSVFPKPFKKKKNILIANQRPPNSKTASLPILLKNLHDKPVDSTNTHLLRRNTTLTNINKSSQQQQQIPQEVAALKKTIPSSMPMLLYIADTVSSPLFANHYSCSCPSTEVLLLFKLIELEKWDTARALAENIRRKLFQVDRSCDQIATLLLEFE